MPKKTTALDWFKAEIISISTTALAYMALEAGGQLMQLYQGNVSRDVIFGLILAFGRSILKAILQQMFPKIISPARLEPKLKSPKP